MPHAKANFVLTLTGFAVLAWNAGRGPAVAAFPVEVTAASPSAERLIVHEWGTFTSFSGSNSVRMEFRPLLENDLPPFVINRFRQEGSFYLGKSNISAFHRMETPVTYFYTDREREVNVRVKFPKGLLTEFYPPVQTMLPAFKGPGAETLTDSSLDWGKIWLLPTDRLRLSLADSKMADRLHAPLVQRLVPTSDNHLFDHYSYARETDSAIVYSERPQDPQHPLRPHGAFFEKFLFYRGIGNFELPIKVTAHPGNRFEVLNLGSAPLRSLFLLHARDGRFQLTQHKELAGGEQQTLTLESFTTVDELSEKVVQALIEEQLYEKEARAMVKTWRKSWFEEQGTRLFYMLPQSVTDELLPLEVEPQPQSTVRVMVGRLEIMRPEDESHIASVIERTAAWRAETLAKSPEGTHKASLPLPQEIVSLGRLAEPALRRAKSLTDNPTIIEEADVLLKTLGYRIDAKFQQ